MIEDKREDYQNCSVLCYAVYHVHSQNSDMLATVGFDLGLTLCMFFAVLASAILFVLGLVLCFYVLFLGCCKFGCQ